MNIIEYIPYGHENAISRRQLCNVSGLPDRVMRKEIERARQDYVILNTQDGSGYFLPLPEERPLVSRWLAQERSRGRAIGNSTLGAEKWLTGDSGASVISVHGYVRRKHKGADPVRQIDGQMRW